TYVQFRPEALTAPALGDLRVRRALARSLDRHAIAETIYEEEAMVTDAPIPATASFYPAVDRAVAKYPLDLRRADQLMSEAGYAKGADGVYAGPAGRVTIDLRVTQQVQFERERSVMASLWRQAGFDVTESGLTQTEVQ